MLEYCQYLHFKYNNIKIYKHIDIDKFSVLLKNSSCLIGNSSAGIREACVYGTPVINIGTRQQYRIDKKLKKNLFLFILNMQIFLNISTKTNLLLLI